MGNKLTDCCTSKHNIDKDFEDVDNKINNSHQNQSLSIDINTAKLKSINNPNNSNNNFLFDQHKEKNLIKIQSSIRRFLTKKKFSSDLIPGKKVKENFSLDYLKDFPKIIKKIEEKNIELRIKNLKDKKNLEGENEEEEKITKNDSLILSNKNINNNNNPKEKDLKYFCIHYQNNSLYKGFFNKFWKKNGQGIFFSEQEGIKYKGQFIDNEFSGHGSLTSKEGFYYEGEFVKNKATGYGIYYNIDGTCYKGSWIDDLQNGKGEELYADGSKFEGDFKNGKKNGQGIFIWPGSSYYKGHFVDNEISGKGKYYWKDGRMFSGFWVKNKMEGLGIFLWPDGKNYKGCYSEDKKNGYGVFSWPEDRLYEGEWKSGKQEGFGYFCSKDNIRLGEWSNGQKIRWITNLDNDYEKIVNFLNERKKQNGIEKLEDIFEEEKKGYKNDLDIFKLINKGEISKNISKNNYYNIDNENKENESEIKQNDKFIENENEKKEFDNKENDEIDCQINFKMKKSSEEKKHLDISKSRSNSDSNKFDDSSSVYSKIKENKEKVVNKEKNLNENFKEIENEN